MTLSSSRNNDEFKLIQDILAVAVFGQFFNLYPDLRIRVERDGNVLVHEARSGLIHTMRTRDAAKYILRRYW